MIGYTLDNYLTYKNKLVGVRITLSETDVQYDIKTDDIDRLGIIIEEDYKDSEIKVLELHEVNTGEFRVIEDDNTPKFIESKENLDCLGFNETLEEYSEVTKLSSVTCENCPFAKGDAYGEYCGNLYGLDEGLCARLYDISISEAIRHMECSEIRELARLEKEDEYKEEQKRKKELAEKRRRETKFRNWDLDMKIKRINKRINGLKSMGSLQRAFSITDAMFSGKEVKVEKTKFDIEIEKLEQQLEEIKLEKKERNRKARLERKMKE